MGSRKHMSTKVGIRVDEGHGLNPCMAFNTPTGCKSLAYRHHQAVYLNATNQKPRVDSGLLSLKEDDMSPVATPPALQLLHHNNDVAKKQAFEELVSKAFAFKERERCITDCVMLVLDHIAQEANDAPTRKTKTLEAA